MILQHGDFRETIRGSYLRRPKRIIVETQHAAFVAAYPNSFVVSQVFFGASMLRDLWSFQGILCQIRSHLASPCTVICCGGVSQVFRESVGAHDGQCFCFRTIDQSSCMECIRRPRACDGGWPLFLHQPRFFATHTHRI